MRETDRQRNAGVAMRSAVRVGAGFMGVVVVTS
jgi:hypothetical protein